MKRITLLTAGLIFSLCTVSWAEDNHFETTSEGIVEKLSGPTQAPRSRSFKGEDGWSDALKPERPVGETRGWRKIQVVRKDQGKEVWETVIAPEQREGAYVNLRIEFDVDSYAIRPEYLPLLNELGKALNDPRLRNRTMVINGHTDSDGADRYNLILSMNRGQAVKLYLMTHHGISDSRLIVYGYGENMPLRPNTSAPNKQLNRRVEVVAME